LGGLFCFLSIFVLWPTKNSISPVYFHQQLRTSNFLELHQYTFFGYSSLPLFQQSEVKSAMILKRMMQAKELSTIARYPIPNINHSHGVILTHQLPQPPTIFNFHQTHTTGKIKNPTRDIGNKMFIIKSKQS
jgi:hypothetical protein